MNRPKDSKSKRNNAILFICLLAFLYSVSLFHNGKTGAGDFTEGLPVLSAEEAGKRIGEYVVLRGEVLNVHESKAKGKDSLVFINIDKGYPNNPIVLKVEKANLSKFGRLFSIEGKTIYVKGEVTTYASSSQAKTFPAIVLSSPSQMQVQE
jgi:hypothetical protein